MIMFLLSSRRLHTRFDCDWSSDVCSSDLEAEPPQTAPREKTVKYPGRTLPIVSINYKAPAWDPKNKTSVALEVLGQIGFGPKDRKSTRLNSSHSQISYAVFCLKKKKKKKK